MDILIVEDEFHIQRLLRVALEKKGWQVFVAQDADEAIRKLTYCYPEVLVLDYCTPSGSGIEVLATLHRNGLRKGTPIIVLNSRAADYRVEQEMREWQHEDIAFRFDKPFNPQELAYVVRKLVITL